MKRLLWISTNIFSRWCHPYYNIHIIIIQIKSINTYAYAFIKGVATEFNASELKVERKCTKWKVPLSINSSYITIKYIYTNNYVLRTQTNFTPNLNGALSYLYLYCIEYVILLPSFPFFLFLSVIRYVGGNKVQKCNGMVMASRVPLPKDRYHQGNLKV